MNLMPGNLKHDYKSALRLRGLPSSVILVLVAASALAQSDSKNSTTGTSNPTANASTRAPFSAFKIITATNIFNTKRQRNYVPSANPGYVRPRSVESFGLVGVMTYDKGPFAFFEGSASEYQKEANGQIGREHV